MALGLNTEAGGGNYTDIVKFDSRAGRMFRVDRAQDAAGNWTQNIVEITQGFQAIFDMEGIEVGWALFATGVAPSFAMVPLGQAIPPKPSDQHKQTFRLMMKLGKSSGGDVREMASQAKAVIAAVDELHDAYKAGLAANPGKLPIVALTGSTPVVSTGKGQTSTNYKPTFQIVGWTDRPAELTAGGAVASTAQTAAPAVAQPAAQTPAPQPAMAGAEEF